MNWNRVKSEKASRQRQLAIIPCKGPPSTIVIPQLNSMDATGTRAETGDTAGVELRTVTGGPAERTEKRTTGSPAGRTEKRMIGNPAGRTEKPVTVATDALNGAAAIRNRVTRTGPVRLHPSGIAVVLLLLK
ncbi:hypothetical protein IWQ60_006983, partial [Tieghemiomyces parasiticus]